MRKFTDNGGMKNMQLIVHDDDAVAIGELYEKARSSIIDSVRFQAECGERLIAKKGSLSHGQWLIWLQDNSSVLRFNSDSTARRLMALAKSNRALAHDMDEAEAVQISRQTWGHTNPQLANESNSYKAETETGCTVEDLDALASSGKRFGVIYADPPWQFKVYSGKGKQRSAERRYDCSSIDDICKLPVNQLAADDCALFLWCVMPEIPGALEVIKAWGFTYKTVGFTWVKQNKNADSLFWGMGYWTRANAELCLFATKGSPKRVNKDVHQVIMCPVMEHSRKPDEAQVRIERLVDGPYLELYGRRAVPGWTVWGNQIERNLLTREIEEYAA